MENDTKHYVLSKVPEVTLLFWLLKVLATTLGETGGDAVTMSMNLGYIVGTAIFAEHLRRHRQRPGCDEAVPSVPLLGR